jgi:hypothetical protein
MPRQLRVFDHVEDQYRIWAIVRHTRSNVTDRGLRFEVGVAFIGKHAPSSYNAEPWKLYDICTNVFHPADAPEKMVEPLSLLEQRTHTRHNIAVDMHVELVDENANVVSSEQTVTENISARGATLFTTLDVPMGRFVRLTSSQYNLTVHAAIRSRSTGSDGVPRIHVEFIDREWPL